MKRSDTSEQEALRVYVVLGIMLAALGFLVVVLSSIQVSHSAKYERDLRKQSIRRVRIPGARGRLFDRNSVCLADNRPSYCIAIYLEELRQFRRPAGKNIVNDVKNVLQQLSNTLNLKADMTPAEISNHLKRRSPLPLVAWRDVSSATRAALAESERKFPGVDLYIEPVRAYPKGGVAGHLLGYVGRAQPAAEQGEEPYHYYLPEMEGRQGLEKKLDKILRGQAGGQLIRVDVAGIKRDLPSDKEMLRDPVSGTDVKLTIDERIQRLTERALEGQVGAAVVLDPRNGDILAMASSPSFDPNMLSSGIGQADWDRIRNDPAKPLINRAVMARYAPGSLFKPIVAATALERIEGIGPGTEFACPGYFALGNTQLKCWKIVGHGTLAMRKAIEQSCNTYFCNLGTRCGYREIYDMASSMGLGKTTGIEVDAESRGRLPDASSIRTRGDIANISIGQGAVEATPLQMAVVAGAIAMHGRVCRPRLVLGTRPAGESEFMEVPPTPLKDLKWSEETIATIRGGMMDVIQSPTGTGKNALVEDVIMAGKTGTAEHSKTEGQVKKWGWMMIFAPYESPRYAVAMVLENAVSGGTTVAPRLKRMMTSVFGKDEELAASDPG